ncbi:EAL domain-containing protein [Sulfurimonas aquatica]|uniref:EAL domain-containing protein n=1 Tax=Sulfurimonas aquatica TaxID=2672570 RepID=A0A975B0L3_9BACT|nr:EAL domain-containing protein [Sulfurimonas aquatica]QSZ42031.1 EAL domain-containing protein [Sulfurimonas aquatica]
MNQSIQECILYSKDLRLLYVEDNKDARTFTLELLNRFFTDIAIAIDGEDGLKQFKASEFDLVITDLNMPNMDGIEMSKEMKRINESISIIILSAHNETDFFISSIQLGVDGFLLKPLELSQFAQTMSKVVEKIHLKKEVKLYQTELEDSNKNLEQKVQERTNELEYKVYHDDLTGLKNHTAMMKKINNFTFETLVLVDIAGFQKFNDLYGLSAGNTILIKFADSLNEFNAQKTYTLFRVYSDVFAILYASQEIENDHSDIDIQRLIDSFKKFKVYIEEIEAEVDIETTIGIAINQDNLFVKADMALKHAKKLKKQAIIYSEEIDTSKQLLKDMHWKNEIQNAISTDNIIPVFQGIVDIDGNVIKYETLMRLTQFSNNEEKLISPYFFLEASVKTRQYDKLTRIIVEKSFEFMSGKGIDFSINLSFEDLSDPLRVQFLHDQIAKYEIGNNLIMEVLESEVVSDYKMVADILNSFRESGVRIAIDDFGSGYSNFEHILRLNPDYLKIDASLIKEVVTDEKSFTLVKAIAEFSKELGIKVIAEYVSSKEIFDILKELSIDEYQGFYFSMPSKGLELIRDV